MATFPKITSPCPYKGPLSDILDAAEVCRLCHRQVHDLSAMSERRRVAFLQACSGETCVTYRLPIGATVAAAAIAAGILATPAAAQDRPAPAEAEEETVEVLFFTGGIRPQPLVSSAPIQVITSQEELSALLDAGDHTLGDAARRRWDQTHRRLDSGKARREDQG
ncbi:MAG: hypothetical protein JWR84_1088 [Caulobacter sp.]|nr:hypothetical protein [Caulobacter sp.]